MTYEDLPSALKKVLENHDPPLTSTEKLQKYHQQNEDWTRIQGVGPRYAELLDSVVANDTRKDIFVSHKHEDAPIAQAFVEELKHWGIAPGRIFLSSSATNGPVIGENLDAELKKALQECRVLFFLYTSGHADWSWCVYEIGLANHPERNTRVVCLKLTSQPLLPMINQDIVVEFSQTDFERFGYQFHKQPGFLSDTDAFAPQMADDAATNRGRALHQHMKELIGEAKQKSRWGSFRIRLSAETASKLEALPNREQLSSLDRPLDKRAQILSADRWAIEHFGFADFTDGLTIADLLERWKTELDEGQELSQEWVRELCEEMWAIVTDRPPELKWAPLKSARPQSNNLWVYPVICQYWRNQDGTRDFDAYVFYVPPPR